MVAAHYTLRLRRYGALGIEEEQGREQASHVDAATVMHILAVHLLAIGPGDRMEITVEGEGNETGVAGV